MEKNNQKGPLNLARCFGELALMWAQELARMGDDAIVELPDSSEIPVENLRGLWD
jgi:hypothetical protein